MDDIDKEMKVVQIKGKFLKRGNTNTLIPASGAHLGLRLRHDDEDAEFRVIEEGEEVEIYDTNYSILLGYGDGSIPPGANVRANDEILPPGSYYSLEVEDLNARHHAPTHYYKERVEITGDGPVDLTPPPEPEPEVLDPDAHLTPRERELMAVDAAIVRDGTMKFGKKNRIGFFAGVQCPTSNAGAVSLPAGERGEFGVFPFSLASAAVVNRASILVDTAAKGTVTIGIYDASGLKRGGDVSIDVSLKYWATGIFPSEVNLSEGDYFLAWIALTNDPDCIGRTDKVCKAQLRGIGVIDQLNLVNASGVALMGIGRSQPGTALPDVLGRIRYATDAAPILVYFKS